MGFVEDRKVKPHARSRVCLCEFRCKALEETLKFRPFFLPFAILERPDVEPYGRKPRCSKCFYAVAFRLPHVIWPNLPLLDRSLHRTSLILEAYVV